MQNLQVQNGWRQQLQFGEYLILCLQIIMKLQVDYAQAESWKAEGMNVPTECKNGCVYQMEGDDSGKFHVKHINFTIKCCIFT